MSPEEKARLEIDKQLNNAGYVVQDLKDLDLTAAKGVVVREYPTNTGEVDYLIFINQQPVGIIEAKEINKGEKLIVEVEDQTWEMGCAWQGESARAFYRHAAKKQGQIYCG